MSSHISLLAFIFLILANLFVLALTQTSCINNGNYTSNSTYSANLNTVLSSLPTNVNSSGFYHASVGQNQDRANAIVLCRSDVLLDTCRSCIRNATDELLRSCPVQKQAINWMDLCVLRYSNETIFGTLVTGPPGYWVWNTQNARTNPVWFRDRFMADLGSLLDELLPQAANGGSLRKAAARNISTTDFQTIFSLVQCSPDLSQEDCSRCLFDAADDIPICCNNKRGARINRPSCNLRYETYPFYNETRLEELVSLSIPGKDDDNTTRTVIIIVAIAACIMLAVSGGILLRKKMKQKPNEELENEISTTETLQYAFATIRTATNDFSDNNKLGQGGFGSVYKGKLQNGHEIAVKRLSNKSGQGDVEFKNEVLLVAKLQHRNLVRLLGFSLVGTERLLVYEFVQNASLDQFIFDPIKRSYLDWDKRWKIIGGIARGLLYLHEDSRLRIIHRDLKASNVLLDGEMNAKIADFGMARSFVQDETQGNTERIVGTYGYMPPEYAMHGQFSIKSDVFSFGVLILEIVSGQKNNSFNDGDNVENLLSITWKNWLEGTIANTIDPELRAGSGSLRDMLKCIHISLLCVQENAANRPTMASVVLMLNSFSPTLPQPSEPAYFMTSRYGLHEYNSKESNFMKTTKGKTIPEDSSQNNASITELYPR